VRTSIASGGIIACGLGLEVVIGRIKSP
jgi:hypothetical protein